jgi:ABC-2 type transport system permease protein
MAGLVRATGGTISIMGQDVVRHYLVALWFVDLPLQQPVRVLVFAVLGSAAPGAPGVIAGVWSDKFEQLAAFQNFTILPLSFLSGVFYSIHSLPGIWQDISRFNPFFYMIEGFRHGYLGVSDVEPALSLGSASGSPPWFLRSA